MERITGDSFNDYLNLKEKGAAIFNKFAAAVAAIQIAFTAWIVAHTPDLLWTAGLALVAVGVGLIYVPAGLIVGGLALCFTGYAAAGGDPA